MLDKWAKQFLEVVTKNILSLKRISYGGFSNYCQDKTLSDRMSKHCLSDQNIAYRNKVFDF